MRQQHHCLLHAGHRGQLTRLKFRFNFNTLLLHQNKSQTNFTISACAIQKPNLKSETADDWRKALESTINAAIDPHPPIRERIATADDWRKALNKVVPAIVILDVTVCRTFDTFLAGCHCGTGFVVDKRRGVILTNRHVVEGPAIVKAMFVNGEEVTLHRIYVDPVHDFGFFGYNPDEVRNLDYEEIPLAPEAASVGLEIRVVGNDGGEKISIVAGTLDRLDGEAPRYCEDGYNDFNTFYFQAEIGLEDGSSGSPVIDWLGRAIALNAGGKSLSATAIFLPLERVVRALKFLQNGRDSYVSKWEAVAIPRGTLQVTFIQKGFDEVRRLGLRSETGQIARDASIKDVNGMLVVDSVVPGGPAHNQLEPGDVLVRMNGEAITQFLKLETLLDDSVNQKIELHIERGGVQLSVNLLVQDLHAITPNYFLDVSGAVIHPLSYQQARNFRFPCGLVYVAVPGYLLSRAGVPRHAIIKKFAGVEISKLEDLVSVLSKYSKSARVPLKYIHYNDRRRKSVLVNVDGHKWYGPPQIYTRDDSSGLWTVTPAFESDTCSQGREMNLLVGTDVREENGTFREVNWCGCLVQDLHPAIRALGSLPEEGHGVYVLRRSKGSPAHRYKLSDLQWIVEVNGNPTPDLDAFTNAIQELEDGKVVRVKTVSPNGERRVQTLKQDLHNWPTVGYRFDLKAFLWRRTIIKAVDCSVI